MFPLILIFFNWVQPEKIPYPVSFNTGLFISKLDRLVQFMKALLLIFSTFDGITILVSPVHPENADSPILVTLSGIVTDVIFSHPENAA